MLWRRMWLTEGCGGRRRAVATPNRESRKEKKERKQLSLPDHVLTQESNWSDVVLRHTLPVFTGLGWCPIVNWDFVGAMSIFGPDALSVVHQ